MFDLFLEFTLYFLHQDEFFDDIVFLPPFMFFFPGHERTVDMRSEEVNTPVQDEDSEGYKRYGEIFRTERIRKTLEIFRMVLKNISGGKHMSNH